MITSEFALDTLAQELLSGSHTLALATLRPDGAPHVTSVSYASCGLLIYAAIALDSHKAHDIARDSRVSLAFNAPETGPGQTRGLSIDAHAELITSPAELALASELLRGAVDDYARIIAEPDVHPWPGMLFIRITPHTIIVLDYRRGFGHTDVFHPRLDGS
jgi:nitroimidazol reductase NimA-like FMN-containing flavoprotein (pyridoxamine 5'-phosphate oxidase superfamily)